MIAFIFALLQAAGAIVLEVFKKIFTYMLLFFLLIAVTITTIVLVIYQVVT